MCKQHPTVYDGRDENGRLGSWNLEEHGFAFVPAPEPVEDFNDRICVQENYAPDLAELLREITGAHHAFLMANRFEARRPDGALPVRLCKIRTLGLRAGVRTHVPRATARTLWDKQCIRKPLRPFYRWLLGTH